jgi:hypothetical protein
MIVYCVMTSANVKKFWGVSISIKNSDKYLYYTMNTYHIVNAIGSRLNDKVITSSVRTKIKI